MTRDDEPGGVWVRVNLITNAENPPEAYIPPTDLPAVPEIPPCVSTLRAVATCGTKQGGGSGPVATGTTLPATGGRTAPALVLLLAAAAVLSLAARRAVRP